jgi:Protein of unknown function (DUF3443)
MNIRKCAAVKPACFFALVMGMTLLFGCGGGTNSGGNTQTVAVSISPTSATVNVSGTQQFSATVTGTSNNSVTWQVNGTTGGDSTHGTISTAGLYTAPASVPSPATVTVTAVSQADTSKSASATVTVSAVAISISPTSATVIVGDTKQFSAVVSGTTNQSVTWQVNGTPGGDSTHGTISTTGLYTAPATVPSPAAVTVTVVSQADSTKSDSATVTVVAAGISVTLSPTSTTVHTGNTQQFSATVSGTTNTVVTWEVNATPGGDATHGTISATGLYTAPASLPTPATVTVTAVSQADNTKSASATVTITTGSAVNNELGVHADWGPVQNFVNGLFTTVTICVPGTSTCQTIPNVEIDTGSEGLRLLSSAVTLSLPPVTDTGTSTGNVLQECVQFADGSYIWGPVATADIQMAGEVAASNSVQLIPFSPTFQVPLSCSSGGGSNLNDLTHLGANGIIGLGVFQQDCGSACAPGSIQVPAVYYLCPSSSCGVATVPLLTQLQDPVWTFPQDNNGFLITMNSIPDTGAVSATGTIYFGIGTQSNNSLGTAKIYTTDPNTGNFKTMYNSNTYPSYIDSGSNGLYMLDAATMGIPECTDLPGFYCPASTTSFTMTNTGFNSVSGPVTFKIGNADTLLFVNDNANDWIFNDLGGTFPGGVDYGMPFFFGRSIFIGIENQLSPTSVSGPYWAY